MNTKLITRILAFALAVILALGCFLLPAMAAEVEGLSTYYSSAEFEAEFTYGGDDLGATWTAEQTSFRVWAPTASDVRINLYTTGNPDANDLFEQIKMEPDVNGTWVAVKAGDLNGVYYTYEVTVDGETRTACDPYARTTGVNGHRAMIIDLDATDPEGWDTDVDPHFGNSIVDAVIYELHVRDLSIDENSGITNKGKFLGIVESGTTNAQGVPTGLDYIKSLGITHLHLLPSYDYASVDETNPDAALNWGYDPVNYNVPEGSYSTDPYNGEVRVKEMKQMIKSLHDNGISVVLDVVYNHVFDAESYCFNRIVPGYFSRRTNEGVYSNGSACGNDTAAELALVNKFIVDSVKYWADVYHMDGFRFDLAGLIDTETINACIEEVHKTHPNVIFYGEGWTMGTQVTKEGYTMTTQVNSQLVPGFSFFSDTVRDSIRGTNSNASKPGFVAGGGGYTSAIRDTFMGKATWCKSPTQTVNYASCHDGYTLYDRLTLSMPATNSSFQDIKRANNLAAAIVLTSQGVPFFQAGEEMLRSKPLPEGGFEHNSYKSPDSINSIKWENLTNPLYSDIPEYYAGLIAFRTAHPARRMQTAEEVAEHITMLPGLEFNVVACHISAGANGEANEIIAVFNPRANDTVVKLPEGEWTVYVNADKAGTEPLATVTGEVSVETVSACLLVKEQDDMQITVSNGEESSVGIIGGADGPTAIFVSTSPAGIVSTVLLMAGAVCFVVAIVKFLKKRKK